MRHNHKQPGDKPGSKVQQSAAQDADLNRMVARHMAGPGRMGLPIGNPAATRQPRFLDLSSADSYHDMLNRVTQIDELFRRLPGRIRNRFQNRPEILMKFCEDPANTKEAVKLGLIDDPEVIQQVLDAEQMDLEQQAAKAAEPVKADPEAQPSFKKGGADDKAGKA